MKIADRQYRNIYILESMCFWDECAKNYDKDKDLVLTFDFGLKRNIELSGGTALYLDSICDPEELQKNNILASNFFKIWHLDSFGNDIFSYKNIPFGFSFRIYIWSEFLYYIRLHLNLGELRKIHYEKILVLETGDVLSDILTQIGLNYSSQNTKKLENKAIYFFNIHKYMNDALHPSSFKQLLQKIWVSLVSDVCLFYDKVFAKSNLKKTVFAQIYHPTKKIVESLQSDPKIRVVTATPSGGLGLRKFFVQRLIPMRGMDNNYSRDAEILFSNFKSKRCAKLILSNGDDVTDAIFGIIDLQIRSRVSKALRVITSVLNYVRVMPINLEIMIANIGFEQTIVDCVLKKLGVPSYLIINGLLGGKFFDEGKYASFINCYSRSIRSCYFGNAENTFSLGDPRMDDYIAQVRSGPKLINRVKPTVVIGSSGFNNIDLISHSAIEFDFMFDILSAFKELKDEGEEFSLVIKVRPNSFLSQYESFVEEFFPNLDVRIIQKIPIMKLLLTADLYISIYSQTLFEASCIGVPVIYYKKDNEYLDPPFDGNSELVTVESLGGLKQAFQDFKLSHQRYNSFLEIPVMEKYIGHLDGNNLKRNMAFIFKLIRENELKR